MLAVPLALPLAIVAPVAQGGIGGMDPGYGVNGRFEARPDGPFFPYAPLADGGLLFRVDRGYSRTDANGRPDETFGSDGVQAWPEGYGTNGIWARAADGRLLFALGARNKFAVARLGPAGELDPTFGSNGLARIDVAPDSNLAASALAVQPDGKLLLLLQQDDPANSYVIDSVLLVRLLPDGRLDSDFGDGGRVAMKTRGDSMDGVGLGLLADGHIWILTYTETWLTPSGSLAATPADDQRWNIAALLPAGGALATKRINAGHRLARVRADGSIDTSFGPNGDGQVSVFSEPVYLSGVSVSPDGRFIFVTWGRNSDTHQRVSRFIGDGPSAGQPDTRFGDRGTVNLKSATFGSVHGLTDGGAIVTNIGYAYRLLGRDAPTPGFTVAERPSSRVWAESDRVAEIIVSRAAGSDGAIRLRYRTLAESELPKDPGARVATPGVDFLAVDGVIDWSDGDDGDKVISIPLRDDQVQEGIETILVRFEALSPGSWTDRELAAVAINDPPPPRPSSGGPGSAGGAASGGVGSSGGGAFGWLDLLLMLAALVELRRRRRRSEPCARVQRA